MTKRPTNFQTFRLDGCKSTLPKPETKTCPFDNCGVVIQEDHWCCRDHFVRFPRKFRMFANQFKGFWAGDPHFDRFMELAHALNSKVMEANFSMLDDLNKTVAEVDENDAKPWSL